ncbi:hypothetical protein LXA43DRAFT_1069094 [Ganoderma leucocontextum]|nr:hypothetical protein LXA43DRAFT_1069094 [Ganoderma leucocontextum]
MASREDIATSITDAAGGGIEGPFTVLDHESPDMREWLAAKEELYQAARNVVITGPFSNSASSETRRLHQEASMKFSIKTMHLLRICEAQAKMVDVPGKVYEEKLEVSTMIMESMIIQENEKHLRMQQKAMQIVLRVLQAECSALQKSNQGRP